MLVIKKCESIDIYTLNKDGVYEKIATLDDLKPITDDKIMKLDGNATFIYELEIPNN